MNLIFDNFEETWAKISRVLAATPRKHFSFNDELYLETIDGMLFCYRENEVGYAEAVLPCQILQPGKISIPNVQSFKFSKGQMELAVSDKTISLTDTGNPRNFATVALGSEALSERIVPQVETVVLDVSVRNVGWMHAIYPNNPWAFAVIDGYTVASTNNYNFCLVEGKQELIDGTVVAPLEWLANAKKGSMVGFEPKRAWIVDDEFAYSSSLIDKNLPRNWIKNGIMQKLDDKNSRVTVKRDDLVDALEYMHFMSRSKNLDKGLMTVELNGNYLILATAGGEGLGRAAQELPGTAANGSFRLYMFPSYLKSAVQVIDNEDVTIEIFYHEPADAHAFLVYSQGYYNFIPELKEYRDKEQTMK